MNNEKELRIKGGDRLLALINKFSATEKMVFAALIIALILSAVVLVSDVNKHFLVSVPTQGGELTEGVVGLPRLVNPILAFSDTDKDLSSLIYSGLLKYTNGTLTPDLAQSYTISPDGLTYTFTLKPNLFFQDGTPLTADDVVFTINEIQDSTLKSPLRANWSNITIKELNPTQVQFVLKQPYAPFLANTTVGILPKHIWNSVSTDQFIFSEYNLEPIGSGPYKLQATARDSGGIPTSYALVPWKKAQGGEAFISQININFYPDEKTAIAAYDAGAIESIATISPSDAADIASSTTNAHIVTSPLPRIFGVFFNQNENPVLADKAVRQALNMSVNRDTIVKQVLAGYGTAINSPIPVGLMPAGTSSPAVSTTTIATAKALLVKDGWVMDPRGIFELKTKTGTTTLSFSISTPDSPDLTQTAQILKQEWTAIGAQVSIKIYQPNDFNQNVIETRNYDAVLFGESIGNSVDLYAFWHSSQRNPPGLNIAMYVNSQADKILEAVRIETDPQQKLTDYANFSKIIQTDIPAVFLYSPDFIYVVPDKVQGLNIGSLSVPSDRWSGVSSLYIDTDSVWKFTIRK